MNNIKIKKLTNDTLTISSKAREHKLQDDSVINATIGSLYDENNNFFKMNTIDEIVKSLSPEDFYTYSSVDGGQLFYDAVTSWIFDNYKNNILSNMNVKVIATPGGTGAISCSIFSLLNKNETILMPDLYWGPYYNMADINDINVKEYEFIKNNKFNLKGFFEACDEILKEQNKIVTILNDPCNNPTGYSLSEEEFYEIINYMNNHPDKEFFVIYDIAYFDYQIVDYKKSRNKFPLMINANDNIVFNIAFSCSKSFSMYGLRTGALVILSKNDICVNTLYETAKYFARTHWSNVTKAGLNTIIKLQNDSKLKNRFILELNEAKKLITSRGELFNKEAEEVGLNIISYGGGFFVTVLCDKPKEVFEELMKQNIYVIRLNKGLRIAICCLSLNEIKGLARKIVEVIHKVKQY